MNNSDIVEKYIKNHKKHFNKFILIQFIIDIIEIAVFVFAILKIMENKTAFLIVIPIILIIMMSTIMINIKINFGSFKKFSESSSIGREYLKAKNALDKCNPEDIRYSELKANFEQITNTIAEKIKYLE